MSPLSLLPTIPLNLEENATKIDGDIFISDYTVVDFQKLVTNYKNGISFQDECENKQIEDESGAENHDEEKEC